MSDLMELLYVFTRTNRFLGQIDQRDYKLLEELEEENLAKLKDGLHSGQAEALNRLLQTMRERQSVELEAMFQAAMGVARELF